MDFGRKWAAHAFLSSLRERNSYSTSAFSQQVLLVCCIPSGILIIHSNPILLEVCHETLRICLSGGVTAAFPFLRQRTDPPGKQPRAVARRPIARLRLERRHLARSVQRRRSEAAHRVHRPRHASEVFARRQRHRLRQRSRREHANLHVADRRRPAQTTDLSHRGPSIQEYSADGKSIIIKSTRSFLAARRTLLQDSAAADRQSSHSSTITATAAPLARRQSCSSREGGLVGQGYMAPTSRKSQLHDSMPRRSRKLHEISLSLAYGGRTAVNYVSEPRGQPVLLRSRAIAPLTKFKEESVAFRDRTRWLKIVFRHLFDLYSFETSNGQMKKLDLYHNSIADRRNPVLGFHVGDPPPLARRTDTPSSPAYIC